MRALFQAVTNPVVTERYENGRTVGKVKQTMEKVAYLGHVPVIVCMQARVQSQPSSDGGDPIVLEHSDFVEGRMLHWLSALHQSFCNLRAHCFVQRKLIQ